MKNLTVPVAVGILVVLLMLYLVLFQVRETEVVFVERLGNKIDKVYDPGPHFKLPSPIDKVRRYDSRMRVFEGTDLETNTKGLIPIIIKPYVVWRISDAYKFYESQKTIQKAERTLFSLINNTLNEVIGSHGFGELVNSNPEKIQLNQIQGEMLASLKVAAEKDYGLDVVSFGIKQLKVGKDVTPKVFDRMKMARKLQTEAIISEGQSQAKAIKTDADSKRQILLAAAKSRALVIRGEGDAEAAQYYGMLEQEPDFAMFLRTIDALPEILKDNTTYVLPTDAPPFNLIKEVPELGSDN